MIKNLLLVKKMVIKLNKKNPIAKDLYTKKYKPKIVKPKKGKGSFKRKKKITLKSCTNLLYYFGCHFSSFFKTFFN